MRTIGSKTDNPLEMTSVSTHVPEPTPDVTPPTGRARRRVGLAAASLLLVASGVAGGAALATRANQDTAVAVTPTQTVPSTDDSGTGMFAGRGGAVAPQFPSTGGSSSSGAAYSPTTTTDASAEQSTGIVEIASTLTSGTAAGTGLVLSADGTIATNHHVVAGATSLKVTVVSTGQTYTATYVGADATADVAVLKLDDASGLTPVAIADDAAAVEDAVTSVGDAGGDGGSLTAATGTVTGLDQDITVRNDDGSSSELTGLIEMAAYVVPGDSGGAVLNADGEAVGMNVAASSGTRNVTGYAIPISTVEAIADQVLAGDDTASIALGYSGFLGVGLDPDSTKPLIAQVSDGGAADDAGIAVGDTVTSVDGTAVPTADQLRSVLAGTSAGDRVTIGWTTADGDARTATVTLGQAPIG